MTVVDQPTDLAPPLVRRTRRAPVRVRRWFRFLIAGAVLWGLSVLALTVTGDAYVVPTVDVLGCFLVPVAWVIRVEERDRPEGVTSGLLARLFIGGGVLGFLSSAMIETPLASAGPLGFASGVGVIEELSKLVILAWMTRRLLSKTPQAGFVLGAAVGFGFAAFESSGYALSALNSHGGTSWAALEGTVLVRAVITPVTHGLWTAITGGVLFYVSRGGRFRVTPLLGVCVAGVAALHGLWDLMPNLTRGLDLSLLRGDSSALLPRVWPAGASRSMRAFGGFLDDFGLTLLGVAGVGAAHRVRRIWAPALVPARVRRRAAPATEPGPTRGRSGCRRCSGRTPRGSGRPWRGSPSSRCSEPG